MKLVDQSHAKILRRLFDAFSDKEGGLMPDQSNPHYKGLPQCWEWHGPSGTGGYAAIPVKGAWYAGHRVSYFLHHGEIEDGMVVRHRCDNKICTNPEHLIIGTKGENMQDWHERRYSIPKIGVRQIASARQIVDAVDDSMHVLRIHRVCFVPRGKPITEEEKSLHEIWNDVETRIEKSFFEMAKLANPNIKLSIL
jgi:hypothetical protein